MNYVCAKCHPNEQHPDVDYCGRCDLLSALEDLLDACEHWDNRDDPVLTNARSAIINAKRGNQ